MRANICQFEALQASANASMRSNSSMAIWNFSPGFQKEADEIKKKFRAGIGDAQHIDKEYGDGSLNSGYKALVDAGSDMTEYGFSDGANVADSLVELHMKIEKSGTDEDKQDFNALRQEAVSALSKYDYWSKEFDAVPKF